jgi:hypothetical protein
MADLKISQLTAASTPLAGTEVLPIVQGGATVKVSAANLTAGRAISATQLTLTTGNLVIDAAGKGIQGTATNNNADTGVVGEYLASVVEDDTVVLTTTTTTNITSISLTAGDWDITGYVGFRPAATTSISYYLSGISTTSSTIGALGSYIDVNLAATIPGGSVKVATPTVRISLAATTTVYLVGFLIFSVSTATAGGLIRARRIR